MVLFNLCTSKITIGKVCTSVISYVLHLRFKYKWFGQLAFNVTPIYIECTYN